MIYKETEIESKTRTKQKKNVMYILANNFFLNIETLLIVWHFGYNKKKITATAAIKNNNNQRQKLLFDTMKFRPFIQKYHVVVVLTTFTHSRKDSGYDQITKSVKQKKERATDKKK